VYRRRLGTLIAIGCLAMGMAGTVEASPTTVYGVSGSDLYTITDFSTWDTTLVGETEIGGTTPVVLSAIAMNNAGTSLYGVDSTSELYSINPANGVTTAIGSTGIAGLAGLVLSSGGVLYASDVSNGNIYTIDTTTGAATILGSTGLSSPGALAIANGTLYLTAPSGGHDYLYTVNISTGAATPVSAGNGICTGSGNSGTCYSNVGGLAFFEGVMAGFTTGTNVVLINTNTGLVTNTYSYSGSDAGFDGATVYPINPTPLLPIPEPGVLSTSLLGFIAGALVLRKRRGSER
jgi:hypothetical protein